MMPFTRQTLCFCTTICESLGCRHRSSFLTVSILALCSVDNCNAVTSLVPLSALPKTTRESPAFAIYNNPLHMTPTKQHDPTDAIWGLLSHCFFTSERKPSSVDAKAFLIVISDTSCCSETISASQTNRKLAALNICLSNRKIATSCRKQGIYY